MSVQALSPNEAEAVSVGTMPLQLRSRSFTAVVLRMTGAEHKAFLEALDTLMRQAPHFFVNAPLVLDLERAGDIRDRGDFAKLVRELRARKLCPIAIQNGTPEQAAAAFAAGLITLQGGRDVRPERTGTPAAPAPKAPEPVRSGQRMLADRGDLVVVASVSSGAELIAAGNIHIYGTLRGRALAGVNGDRSARIFCQSFGPELIAIAGLYRTSEDLDPALRNQRAQALLRDDALCVEPLK